MGNGSAGRIGVRVLVIEDEAKLASALAEGLSAEGYDVVTTRIGEEGFFLIHRESFDLVILDLMLPKRGGLEILRGIRQDGRQVPVLILTSRDLVEDRVAGLDAGADDYMVKPFAMPELSARVRALLRRQHEAPPPRTLRLLDLELGVASRVVTRAGRRLDLTPREFALLEYLLLNAGRVVSREMLAKDVWQETARHTPIDNVIDVQVARLRKKVDDPFPVRLLQTVRGVGFVMRVEPA
jgi:two-component system, OmpR family, copper resistance phosphate regulon response regulator CusR